MLVPRGVEALNSERHQLNKYYKVILQNEDLASFFHSSDYTIPFVKQSLNSLTTEFIFLKKILLYIQWIFPLDEPSNAVWDAPVLIDQEIDEILNSSKVRRNR